jgi:hypothetical protein
MNANPPGASGKAPQMGDKSDMTLLGSDARDKPGPFRRNPTRRALIRSLLENRAVFSSELQLGGYQAAEPGNRFNGSDHRCEPCTQLSWVSQKGTAQSEILR